MPKFRKGVKLSPEKKEKRKRNKGFTRIVMESNDSNESLINKISKVLLNRRG